MRKAVIDMGTNSIRLAIGSLDHGALKILYQEVAYTRMGEGMGEERKIRPVPLERNVRAVAVFVQKAREMGVGKIRLTATSAMREAANQQQAKEAIEQAAGVPLEILPGPVEAQLSYLGASGDFMHYGQPVAVLDIGGGSTELVYPAANGLHGASVPIGAVRLAENPALLQQTREILQGLQAEDGMDSFLLIAAGGTNTCLVALELGLEAYAPQQIHGRRMEKAAVDRWTEKLLHMTQAERLNIKGLKPERADIIPYGAFILQQTMELFQKKFVYVSDKGLVYGLLVDESW